MTSFRVTCYRLFSLLAICFVLFGCDQGISQVDVDTCRSDLVLATLDGRAITAGDFRARRSLETAVFCYRRKNLPAQRVSDECAKFVASRNRRILAELVNQTLIKRYLEKCSSDHLSVGDVQTRMTTQVERAVEEAARKINFKTIGQAATVLGVQQAYLEDQLAVPERIVLAREFFAGKPFSVTEAEIDEGLARMVHYHDHAVASNAVTYATASNVLARVRAGGDFALLGRQLAGFAPEEANEWGDFEASDLENEVLRKWAFSAPVGSVGGPFDIEDGLCVVKILARTGGSVESSLAAAEVASVKLARIAFYMLEENPEPRTRTYVRETLGEWKATEAQKALFASLHAEMHLVYPNGTNFVFSTSVPPLQSLREDVK